MTDPVSLIRQIDDGARALDTSGRELGLSIKAAAEAEIEYERSMTIELLKVKDEYDAQGEKLPAEGLRTAMAHKRIKAAVYADYITTKARVDALRGYLRALEAATSARQSLLKAMTDEARYQA